MIVAIPAKPPEDNWLGNKNKDVPNAIKAQPNIISIPSFKYFLIKI